MEVTGIFGFLVLVVQVYAVLQIAQSAAGNGRKALWIAVVVVLPGLGVIIWYLIGPGSPLRRR